MVFDKTGLVKVFCNIHSDMVGHILVLENEYFAKVNSDCSFQIESPQDGEYKISAWYKKGKGSSKLITIKSGKIASIGQEENLELVLPLKQTRKRLRQHKNKHGKAYKKSY